MQPVTRTEAVLSHLRGKIVRFELPPGERIDIDEVATSLQVSRMPVRDALHQLSREGLVTIFPHKGVEVSVLVSEQVEELFAIRESLESLALERAAPRLEAAHWQQIDAVLDRAEQQDISWSEWAACNNEFHTLIYVQSGWKELLAQIQIRRTNVERYLYKHLSSAGLQKSNNEHRMLAAALKRRDVNEAKSLLRNHLLGTANSLRASLEKEARARSAD